MKRSAVLTLSFLLSFSSLQAGGAAVRDWDHEWLNGAVFYQVFVRSFSDSDGDGIGDLRGLISKLDYLNDGDPTTTGDLGVQGLWLMPIFPSPSYHGYDVTDYTTIKPDYGDLDDFHDLVAEAERRGIRIILDLAINHTSSEHPWFVDAADSGTHRNWYVWSQDNPGWTQPWGNGPVWHPSPTDSGFYYGLFWRGMPDLNFATQGVRKQAERLARLWLKRGAAGFRLDAVRYLIEEGEGPGQADTPRTHAYWRRFAKKIRRRFPQSVLAGEAWADTETIGEYYGSTSSIKAGNELPLNFNFPLASAILQSIRRESRAPVVTALRRISDAYPEGARDAPFLTNHDQRRLASELSNNTRLQRKAASILLTLPGVPFIYYGEEIGLRNGPTSGDESKRTPMAWNDSPTAGFTAGEPWFPLAPGHRTTNVASQAAAGNSLLSHYRRLIRARRESEALASGGLEVADLNNRAVLAFERRAADERALVAINLSSSLQLITGISVDARVDGTLLVDGSGASLAGSPGNLTLVLPPHVTGIWSLADSR
jgi:glycosidase